MTRLFSFFLFFIFTFLFFLPPLFTVHAVTQTISVTATVPPQINNFQFAFTSDSSKTVGQSSVLTYTITYGAKSTAGAATANIIVANFSHDTVNDAHILDYVVNSATVGYGNATPIIDLVNRTITWNINGLPPGKIDQTLSFQVKTNPNYTGSSIIPLIVTAKMSNDFVDFPVQSITQNYQYIAPSPASSPLPASPTTTVASPNPTTSPSPIPTPLTFSDIKLLTLSDTSLTLQVDTTSPVTLTVQYGTVLPNFPQSLKTLNFLKSQEITLSGLIPQTTYYLRVFARNSQNETISSDILTFTTAETALLPHIDTRSILFLTSDIVLYTSQIANDVAKKPVLVVPQGTVYHLRFQVSQNQNIKKIQILVTNKQVLGMDSSESVEPNTLETILIEVSKGTFEGRLKTSSLNGSYEVFARISDTTGHITQEPIADLYISDGIRVTSEDNQPIENAQIFLYHKDAQTGQFEVLAPELFPIKNPNYTDINGKISTSLPVGEYKAKITSIGYIEKEVIFRLGARPEETYPHVVLQREVFSFLTTGKYYWSIFSDVIHTTRLFMTSISTSHRFFEFSALTITGFFVFLTLLSFVARIRIPLRLLLKYFTQIMSSQDKQRAICAKIKGKIVDLDTGTPLSQSDVFLLDSDQENILSHTHSDAYGNFSFDKNPSKNYSIEVMSEKYQPLVCSDLETNALKDGQYVLKVSRLYHHKKIIWYGKKILAHSLGILFETLLVLSLLFEISLGTVLGFQKVSVFLFLSLLNIILWLIHTTYLRKVR